MHIDDIPERITKQHERLTAALSLEAAGVTLIARSVNFTNEIKTRDDQVGQASILEMDAPTEILQKIHEVNLPKATERFCSGPHDQARFGLSSSRRG